jgi:hypothetical protein
MRNPVQRARQIAAAGLALAIVLSILDGLGIYTRDEPLWVPLGLLGAAGCFVTAGFLVGDFGRKRSAKR